MRLPTGDDKPARSGAIGSGPSRLSSARRRVCPAFQCRLPCNGDSLIAATSRDVKADLPIVRLPVGADLLGAAPQRVVVLFGGGW